MNTKVQVCVLAAGKGTRLKLNLSKALLPIRGKMTIDYCIDEYDKFFQVKNINSKVGFVLSYQKEKVEAYLASERDKKEFYCTTQHKINGTGGAVKDYLSQTDQDSDYIIVSCVDTPLLKQEVFSSLYEKVLEGYDVVLASFSPSDPYGYGRIVRTKNSFKIVEEKDASEDEKKIGEVNAGVYIFKTSYLLESIDSLDTKNKANEYYLTDLLKDGIKSEAVEFNNSDMFIGINNLVELSTVEKIMNKEKVNELMQAGVRIHDPERTWIEDSVTIGKGCEIYPDVYLKGNTSIGDNVFIEPNCWIVDSQIENNVCIKAFSHIEETKIGSSSQVGPFARLRPGADLGECVKVGNFVEIKKAQMKDGAKASHLAYIGDAEIGENTNIGCGVITVNYDGKNKHKTTIGKNSFIGSDTQLVAPVNLGENTFVACGSTITKDLEEGDFAIARSEQVTKKGMARRFLKVKK